MVAKKITIFNSRSNIHTKTGLNPSALSMHLKNVRGPGIMANINAMAGKLTLMISVQNTVHRRSSTQKVCSTTWIKEDYRYEDY